MRAEARRHDEALAEAKTADGTFRRNKLTRYRVAEAAAGWL